MTRHGLLEFRMLVGPSFPGKRYRVLRIIATSSRSQSPVWRQDPVASAAAKQADSFMDSKAFPKRRAFADLWYSRQGCGPGAFRGASSTTISKSFCPPALIVNSRPEVS
jgi:hypothetical protein